MNKYDLAALLSRAAAALETPADLSPDEVQDLITDLDKAREEIQAEL
uniref:Uncharacterized protein n=1 Tax=Caulobacter phage BL57 TaxID=3348355 RepID=A0AB74UGW0_9VIRU